mmetsp:Transcript_104192/g.176228  ORF Transcript_104192/g.176228 Transcript_104192/m.176228 type:complete len:137 (-) Transcript_104192:114-524(-)
MEPAEAVELLRKGDARVALSYHNLGAQGAEAIAEELKTNSTCTDLHMNGNAMGSDGAWALAEALKQNSTLTHLHLQMNDLGDPGGESLLDAIKLNNRIQKLGLQFNDIDVEIMDQIHEQLARNMEVTQLRVHVAGR